MTWGPSENPLNVKVLRCFHASWDLEIYSNAAVGFLKYLIGIFCIYSISWFYFLFFSDELRLKSSCYFHSFILKMLNLVWNYFAVLVHFYSWNEWKPDLIQKYTCKAAWLVGTLKESTFVCVADITTEFFGDLQNSCGHFAYIWAVCICVCTLVSNGLQAFKPLFTFSVWMHCDSSRCTK